MEGDGRRGHGRRRPRGRGAGREAPPPRPPLNAIPRSPSPPIAPAGGAVYQFFAGKGGTGKTTCAAAAAIAAAERGRRVLVVSTDPAHSLGDALGRRLGPRPARVPTRRGDLQAVELDADRALARWLAERRAALRVIAQRGTYLDDEDIERLMRLSLPGVDELVGLIELTRLGESAPYQDVVVDTAPTGHALRLLATPATIRRVAGILDHMYAKHRFLVERLGGAYRPDASDALIDEMAAGGARLHGTLRDRGRTSFTWTLLPEPLAVEETKDGVRELARSGLTVTGLVVNRLTPRPPRPCGFCQARVRAEAAAVRAVAAALPCPEIFVVPDAGREPRGLSALRAIGRRLARPVRNADRAARRRPGAPPLGPAGRAARPGCPAWLEVLGSAGTRLVLFAGKGGVGKTTCAATAALTLAAQADRRRILLLSTDPAHSLADVLATPLGDEARALPGAPRTLRARELDAERAFRRRRAQYRAAVDELFDTLRRGSAFDATFDRTVVGDLIDLAPPGLDELFAVLTVTEALVGRAAGRTAYDAVVVDTAPTGHTLRLLALPATALDWIRALLAIILKYRHVVGPGALARELVTMSRELRQLETLLRDRQATRVVAVTRAAEVPRLETTRLLTRVRRLGIPVAAVLVNALTPAGSPACRRCARARAAEARAIAAIRRDCRRLAGPGCQLIRTPAVAPPPRGIGPLLRWGHTWAAAA